MRKTIYPFLAILVTGIILVTGLPSCRKDKIQLSIKQYDSVQIQNYIASRGLTGFMKDTTGGDTSGIYYKIIIPGSGTPIKYSDKLPFVYSEQTFDGTYALTDTISQHYYDFVGHLQNNGYPLGLQTAVHNLLVYPNASMRVLIPSHLAYGTLGTGSGSSQIANSKIAGNQCLDVYVHAIKNFGAYDNMVIQNYMKANNLTGYSMTPDSVYYKVETQGTGTDSIRVYSSFTCTYTGQLLDGNIFDGSHNGTNTVNFPVLGFATPGNTEVLEKYAVAGTLISILLPSKQAYGLSAPSGIPAFSCMRFSWNIISVAP
jgi:FKBP-type peptidyl-prolyl cis-trans isomerase